MPMHGVMTLTFLQKWNLLFWTFTIIIITTTTAIFSFIMNSGVTSLVLDVNPKIVPNSQ
jgi:hypothetical protein